MNLGTLKQILDLDRLDTTDPLGHLFALILAEIGEVRRGEDTYIVVEEDRQILGRRDMLHLKRRDDNVLHLLGFEQADDIVVLNIHLHAEQFVLDIVVGIGKEADRTIGAIHAGVEHLGDGETCRLRAVDHHRSRTRAVVRHVLEAQFDRYAPCNKQHYAYEDVRVQDRVQQQTLPRRIADDRIDKCRHKTGSKDCKHDLRGIDERREPQDSRVGMEEPECQSLEQHQDSGLLPDRQYALLYMQACKAVADHVTDNERNERQEHIDKQHAPLRQVR